ncbi:uncharacterized protein LOC144067940 [Stigmatopora argus]
MQSIQSGLEFIAGINLNSLSQSFECVCVAVRVCVCISEHHDGLSGHTLTQHCRLADANMTHYILPVPLQILLAVLLAVFCYCLVLALILRCRPKKVVPPVDEEMGTPRPRLTERVTATVAPTLSTRPVRQQYEELDGNSLDFASSKSSSSPSEDDLSDLAFDSGRSSPIRRLSSPAAPLERPQNWSQARTRRSTVTGEGLSQRATPSPARYGSIPAPKAAEPAPSLHFSLLYSSSGTLVVNILGLSGRRRGKRVLVRASLPPLCPSPQRVVSRRSSFGPDSQSVALRAGSVERLRSCTLRLEVYGRDFSGLREVALGVVEMPCQRLDWEADTAVTCTRQLSPVKSKLKKSVSSQDTCAGRKSSLCPPRSLGQLFVLLQYQASAGRIKVMVRKAEQLAKLTRIPGAPDHYVIIKLHHDGRVIGAKETKGVATCSPVWNAPFLFDLPPGDIAQLPLLLEFVVMQGRLYTKSSILGRVLIGGHVSDEGRGHWKEMCSRGPVETARWHAIQSDLP